MFWIMPKYNNAFLPSRPSWATGKECMLLTLLWIMIVRVSYFFMVPKLPQMRNTFSAIMTSESETGSESDVVLDLHFDGTHKQLNHRNLDHSTVRRMTLLSWIWSPKDEAQTPLDSQGSVKQSSCPVRLGSASTGVSNCPISEEARRDHPMIMLDPRNNMKAGGESQ